MVDYIDGSTGLIPSDVLELRLEGDGKLIIRPSGTEPKLKIYLSVKAGSESEAHDEMERLSSAAQEMIL